MNEEFTLEVLLKAKNAAKAAQSEIKCAICGVAGVADQPDSLVLFMPDGTDFVHAKCAEASGLTAGPQKDTQ